MLQPSDGPRVSPSLPFPSRSPNARVPRLFLIDLKLSSIVPSTELGTRPNLRDALPCFFPQVVSPSIKSFSFFLRMSSLVIPRPTFLQSLPKPHLFSDDRILQPHATYPFCFLPSQPPAAHLDWDSAWLSFCAASQAVRWPFPWGLQQTSGETPEGCISPPFPSLKVECLFSPDPLFTDCLIESLLDPSDLFL